MTKSQLTNGRDRDGHIFVDKCYSQTLIPERAQLLLRRCREERHGGRDLAEGRVQRGHVQHRPRRRTLSKFREIISFGFDDVTDFALNFAAGEHALGDVGGGLAALVVWQSGSTGPTYCMIQNQNKIRHATRIVRRSNPATSQKISARRKEVKLKIQVASVGKGIVENPSRCWRTASNMSNMQRGSKFHERTRGKLSR